MSDVAALIADMVRQGVDPDIIGRTAALIADARTEAAENKERRKREQNAARQAAFRERNACNVTNVTPPLSPLSPPHTPPQNPPIIPHSDTDVSAQAPADFRSDLFRRGVSDVMAITGLPAPRVRTLIGSWLKLAKDEAIHVLRAIDDATEAKPADPVPWIRRAIEAQMRTRDPPKRVWGSV